MANTISFDTSVVSESSLLEHIAYRGVSYVTGGRVSGSDKTKLGVFCCPFRRSSLEPSFVVLLQVFGNGTLFWRAVVGEKFDLGQKFDLECFLFQ